MLGQLADDGVELGRADRGWGPQEAPAEAALGAPLVFIDRPNIISLSRAALNRACWPTCVGFSYGA